uniref:Chromophore lyase n=1 Tax=Inkyuleea mariana TaxID=123988 RepID=A0A4D6X2M3_9FLOR|nr:hypothetical protein [Inkyuleea mariana]
MKLNLEMLLEQMEGDWISQKTLYYLKKKYIYNNKSNIKILKLNNFTNNIIKNSSNYNIYNFQYSNKKNNDLYFFSKKSNYSSGNIKKISSNDIQNYHFQLISSNCLIIQTMEKNIKYIEYIYYINKNFRISITLLKKINQYIAIAFTSYIRIIQANT